MIKFVADSAQGCVYGFGLTESNLNRLEFNNELIFFDFDYANHPELFGLILYLGEFDKPSTMTDSIDATRLRCIPFLDIDRGVTPESLRVFPIAKSIMQKLRDVNFQSFETRAPITSTSDVQLFFAGTDERSIERHFQLAGFISPQTKRTYKGFGRQES